MSLDYFTKKFENIYIHDSARDSEVAQNFREIFSADQIHEVSRLEGPTGELSAREFNQSKKNIFITKFKGQFFKRCPGSSGSGLACCNYYVLNLGLQCDMNCSYCYLQSFINTPMLTIYSNIEDAIQELREMYLANPLKPVRVGTGETIDSLSLDPLTKYSQKLISAFRQMPGWKLEFKTKSHFVDQFVGEPHSGNVIVSWSINPQDVITHEEFGTASLEERLAAAEKSVRNGFQVSFHIDPMIWHPDWKKNYLSLADEINRRFEPAQVLTISVGALRFQSEQRHMMRERFGMKSYVTSAETFTGHDGKLRYDLDLRNEMFDTLISRFKSLNPKWRIFLCMESPETWVSNFSTVPMRVEGLKEIFEPISL